MRFFMLSLLLLLRGGLAGAGPVGAGSGDESHFQTRSTAVYALVGLGTPLGWGGAEIEQTLTSMLALSGGVGMGFSGPQVAVMPRLRLGLTAEKSFAFTFGAGASYGRFHWDDRCFLHCTSAVAEGNVVWANLEVGAEVRLASGFSGRLFFGHGNVVAGQLVCTERGTFGCDLANARALGYVGTAVGWAF